MDDVTFTSFDAAFKVCKESVVAVSRTNRELVFSPKQVLEHHGGRSAMLNCIKIQEKDKGETFSHFLIDQDLPQDQLKNMLEFRYYLQDGDDQIKQIRNENLVRLKDFIEKKKRQLH